MNTNEVVFGDSTKHRPFVLASTYHLNLLGNMAPWWDSRDSGDLGINVWLHPPYIDMNPGEDNEKWLPRDTETMSVTIDIWPTTYRLIYISLENAGSIKKLFTHWGRHEMAIILQTISNSFSFMKIVEFCFKIPNDEISSSDNDLTPNRWQVIIWTNDACKRQAVSMSLATLNILICE